MRVLLLLVLCLGAQGDDTVTVTLPDGRKVSILNGEQIIRQHGLQRGMDIIRYAALLIRGSVGKVTVKESGS